MISMKPQQPQSLKQYIKWLEQAVDKGHLYDTEEYARIKKELYQAKKLRQLVQAREKAAYGFGYKFESLPRPTDLSDTRSGEDDGVRSESEQPSESGEPERSGTTEVLYQA
jgi:hypothetical protein